MLLRLKQEFFCTPRNVTDGGDAWPLQYYGERKAVLRELYPERRRAESNAATCQYPLLNPEKSIIVLHRALRCCTRGGRGGGGGGGTDNTQADRMMRMLVRLSP